MGQFHEKLHQILKNLLQQSTETRHLLLSWLGNCLQANMGRAKIWANQMPEIFFQMYSSDAFFLNLGAALLKLCQPFCRPHSPKLLTFNPTYCALKDLSEEERRNRNVHARGRIPAFLFEHHPFIFFSIFKCLNKLHASLFRARQRDMPDSCSASANSWLFPIVQPPHREPDPHSAHPASGLPQVISALLSTRSSTEKSYLGMNSELTLV